MFEAGGLVQIINHRERFFTMFQQAQNTAVAIMVLFASVAWRIKNNFRLEANYGDANEIRNSLATYQWVPDNPVPVTKITESELTAELAERQAKWDAFKAVQNPTPDQLVELQVFEQLFTEPVDPENPTGERKLIVPEYSGNAGFRRSSAFFGAMVQRQKERAKPENAGLTISGLVPVRVATYASNADRIIDQQLENEMQGRGTVKMVDLDKLRVTKALFDEGCREVQIRQLYSSSTGQKTFGICLADANFPELSIYPRFLLPSDAPGFIPWGPVRGADLVRINNRYEADRKRKEGLPLKNDERGLEPLVPGEVADWFADKAKTAGDGNASKSMKKTDMEAGSKNHKLLAVRKVFDSVLGNTQANLKPLMDYAEPMNGITQLILDGKGDEAERIVKVATTETVLFNDIYRVIDTGKIAELKAAVALILNPPVVVQAAPTPVPVAEPVPVPVAVEPTPEPQGKKAHAKAGKS